MGSVQFIHHGQFGLTHRQYQIQRYHLRISDRLEVISLGHREESFHLRAICLHHMKEALPKTLILTLQRLTCVYSTLQRLYCISL
jgi:hypothetical protein